MSDSAHLLDHTASPLFPGLTDESPPEFSFVRHPAPTETLKDMHFELEVGFVRTGRMERHLPGWQARLDPGDLWLCGVWEPHAYRVVEAPCVVGVFVISPVWLARLSYDHRPWYDWLAPFTAPPAARPTCTGGLRAAVASIAGIIEECDACKKAERDAWVRVMLQQLLLTARRQWTPPPIASQKAATNSFSRVLPALRMAFESKAHVPVREAARACAMSRNSFERAFSQAMGIGFARFALRRRLRGAALALTGTSMPVKTIAYDWGFTDPSHLQHAFTHHYGCTPGEYRRAARIRRLPA